MPIVIENLSYTYMKKTPYEKKALDGVTLTIEDGDTFGIIGATGSGKSTLIQHLNALIRVTEGKIVVNGMNLSEKKLDLKRLRSTVGMVFQYPEYQLFEETVEKDIAFGLKNIGVAEAEIADRVREAAELCGLDFEEVKSRSPFELSGGQMRRAAIAGVIAMRPEILVFDEPTAGLDPRGRAELLSLIRKLKDSCSKTIIMVSHNMDEITAMCNRVAVLDEGRLAACDAPRKLFFDETMLSSLGLDVPTAVKLANLLKKRGVELRPAMTPPAFAEAFWEYYIEARR